MLQLFDLMWFLISWLCNIYQDSLITAKTWNGLKIPLLSSALKLSHHETRCRVLALHIIVKNTPPMAFQHRGHSDKPSFSVLFQDQHLFQRWKAIQGLKCSGKLWTPWNGHFHIYSLWFNNSRSDVPVQMKDENARYDLQTITNSEYVKVLELRYVIVNVYLKDVRVKRVKVKKNVSIVNLYITSTVGRA
jgi:hypothetical protein